MCYIIVILTKHSHIATSERFLETYSDSTKANQGLEILSERTLLPITITSPIMRPLNVLGLYNYYSGSLMHQDGKFQGSISIGKSRPNHVPLIELTRLLGIEFTKNNNTHVFGENGRIYSRLLQVIGFHATDEISRKAQSGSRLPEYLENIIENYKNYNKEMQKYTHPLLRDLINVWIDTKYTSPSPRSLRVYLICQPFESSLVLTAMQICTAMSYVYPNVNLSLEQFHFSAKKNTYAGYFDFTKDQLENSRNYISFPVKLKVEVTPSFSFHNPLSSFNRNQRNKARNTFLNDTFINELSEKRHV